MKPFQIEAWALKVIEQVELGQPNEDFRVELKSEWIDAKKAARLIAGHANAARGEPILWLIGVDEKKGVVGADNAELANWYPQVQKRFDGLAPQFIDINIPVRDKTDPDKYKTVVALLFETDRAPFVYKNPDGGEITQEVPWREGRRTRSANRSDLIKLLTPLQKLPIFEVLQAYFFKHLDEWRLVIEIYVHFQNSSPIVIPFHRCEVWVEIFNASFRLALDNILLMPNYERYDYGESGLNTSFISLLTSQLKVKEDERLSLLSLTIRATTTEVIINGSGKLILLATTPTAKVAKDLLDNNVYISASLLPSGAEKPIMIDTELVLSSERKGKVTKWTLNKSI